MQKLDLEPSLTHGPRLADELVQALLGKRAVPPIVYIETVRVGRREPVDQHPKGHGRLRCWRPHYQVKVARMELVGKPSAVAHQHDALVLELPLASERPLIAAQALWRLITWGPLRRTPPVEAKLSVRAYPR